MKRYPITIHPDKFEFQNELHREWLKDSAKKKPIKAEIVVKTRVTKNQRGYLFQGIISFIHRLGMYPQLSSQKLTEEVTGYYHELLKQDFNGIDIGDRRIGRSIASEDRDGFERCLELLNQYTTENFGVPIPTSDEWIEHRDTLKDGEFLTEYLKKWS